MSMKRKTILSSLLLATTLTLAACGDNVEEGEPREADEIGVNPGEFPIVEEEITLSLLAPGTGMAEWEDMPALQEYSEMTGINFNYTTPPLSDFDTRFNLAFASGELPDVVFAPGSDVLTPELEVEYGTQGVLMPLNDLIEEYAPNLQALLEENPEIQQSITTTDGNIYALPQIGAHQTAVWTTGPMWYNGEFLEALDMEMPTTVDEFRTYLERVRDEDPNGTGTDDTIPFSAAHMNWRPWILSAFGITEWGVQADYDAEEVFYAPITDNAREYYIYLNELFADGLIDEELFSQSDEQVVAKGGDNRLGVFQNHFSFFTTGKAEEDSLGDIMFGPLTSDIQPEPLMPAAPEFNRGAFAITTANEHPEATMAWVDWMYTNEGMDFFDRGPAGPDLMWDWVDDPELGEIRVETEIAAEEGEDLRGTITPFYGISTPGLWVAWGEMDPIIQWDVYEAGEAEILTPEESIEPFQQFIIDETAEKIDQYAEVGFPPVYLEPEENDVIQSVRGDIETYLENAEAQFVTGQLDPADDGDWETYVSTIEGMNLEEYLETYQAAFDRWVEAGEEIEDE